MNKNASKTSFLMSDEVSLGGRIHCQIGALDTSTMPVSSIGQWFH